MFGESQGGSWHWDSVLVAPACSHASSPGPDSDQKAVATGFSLVSFVLIDNIMTGICVKCLKVTFEESQSFKCVYLGRFVQKQPFPHHHLQPVQLIVLYRETTWVRAP